MKSIFFIICLIFLIQYDVISIAKPIIQKSDRFEINWGTLKIQFYGKALANKADANQAFKKASQNAWAEGINYLIQNLPTIYPNLQSSTKAMYSNLSAIMAKNTYSKNTIYYANKLVKVELETPLWPILLQHTSLNNLASSKNLELSSTTNSGIIIKISQKIMPIALYTIRNEKSELLFSIKDIYQETLKSNMLGFWFNNPTLNEIKPIVGDNPLELYVKVEDTKFLISSTLWTNEIINKNNFSLLQQGKIVISCP